MAKAAAKSKKTTEKILAKSKASVPAGAKAAASASVRKTLPKSQVKPVAKPAAKQANKAVKSANKPVKKAVAKNPNAKVLAEKFGDSGVAVQLQLIQDALQAYPDMNVVWGTAPTAEAAIGAVRVVDHRGDGCRRR